MKSDNNQKGMLVIISSPSGCGKDSVIDGVFEKSGESDNLFYSISVTSRERRENEIDGKHYIFKTKLEFEKLISENAFLEYTNYCGNYYGTLKSTVDTALNKGKCVVLKIEVEGAAKVRRIFDDCVSIFILPPSIDELRRRLETRSTEDEATIERRVNKAASELGEAEGYNYRVINDVLETAVDETLFILKKEYDKRNNLG